MAVLRRPSAWRSYGLCPFAIDFAKGTESRLIIRTCKHILDRGVFCRAPAMNKRDYCHAHLRLRQCRWRMARAGRRLACLKLPPAVDMQAVRTTTVRVRAALAGGHIDPSWARLMFWAMQLATANLRYMERRPPSGRQFRSPPGERAGPRRSDWPQKGS